MIKLIKQKKKNQKTTYMLFNTFAELEKELKKISTAKYNSNDYVIESDNFKELTEYFEKLYNKNYYVIDDVCGLIYINKLPVGMKRKKNFSKRKLNRLEIIEKMLETLNQKFPVVRYNEEKDVLSYHYLDFIIEFLINKDFTIEEYNFKVINPTRTDIRDLKMMLDNAQVIKKYFKRLSKRQK